MGLFSKRPEPTQTITLQPYVLRTGTSVPIVNIDPAFIAWARAECPHQPRIGHVVEDVALVADGPVINVIHNGQFVAQIQQDYVRYYAGELLHLQRRGQVGVTDAYIRPDGWKLEHAVALAYSEHAIYGEGIL